MTPWLVTTQHLTIGQIVGCVFYLVSGLKPTIQILVSAEPSAAHPPGLLPTNHEFDVDAVGLADILSSLGGDDAQLPPGGGPLSAGRELGIALARVYLSDAQVVILDEATCHLDPVAEARAEQAFAQRHGTLVVIAHRISSAMRANRVLVMDGDQPGGAARRVTNVLRASSAGRRTPATSWCPLR